MSILIAIILMAIMIKVTTILLKICGRIVGGCIAMAGYILIAAILVIFFGIALYSIPILLLIGIVSITEWKENMK